MAKPKGNCYLCGIRPADSWDHTPPKTLFPKDTQNKGYKLPACSICNNLLSKDEEYIRDYFTICGRHPITQQVFRDGTRRSYLRPYELLKTASKLDRINKDLQPMQIMSPGGVIIGMATGIKINTNRVSSVAIKIVKGLYFYHFGNRIPDEYSFGFFFEPPNILPDLLNKKTRIIGRFGDVFCYKGISTKQDPFASIWWLAFYRSFGAIVIVEPPKLTEPERDKST